MHKIVLVAGTPKRTADAKVLRLSNTSDLEAIKRALEAWSVESGLHHFTFCYGGTRTFTATTRAEAEEFVNTTLKEFIDEVLV